MVYKNYALILNLLKDKALKSFDKLRTSASRVMHSLKMIIKKFLILIIPSLCAGCRSFLSERNILCAECALKIFPIVSSRIDVTASFSVTVFAISDYKDPLKKMILAKRWSDPLASAQLGELLCSMTPLKAVDCDFITPIPLHWTRYAARGFNQAEEIAKVVSKKKQIPLVHILKRVKKTAFQFDLTSASRGANVKNAFVLRTVDTALYKDKHIVLIDDLMTTGSTIREAAKELLKLKPKKITVVVACRVI
jgi:ComF family protein